MHVTKFLYAHFRRSNNSGDNDYLTITIRAHNFYRLAIEIDSEYSNSFSVLSKYL